MNRKSIIGILMMKLLDLFSGIGGFSLGMEATKKIKTIAFCEKDEFCRKVLKKHWSNIKQYNDIRSINGKEIAADIVSGGFPCQPFSVAGKRKGTEDDRYLWDEMLRVITEVKPRWVVGENVQGIINIDNGLVLRQVQTDLEAQGFQVQCFIIPASGVGAWHQRNRVWIVAYSDKFRCTQHNETKKEKFEWRSKTSFMSSSSQDVSNSDKERIFSTKTTRNNGKNEKKSFNEYIGGCSSTYRGKIIQNYWATEPNVGRVAHGIPNRVDRIKSLGNAIVPQIAYEIGQAILKAEYE